MSDDKNDPKMNPKSLSKTLKSDHDEGADLENAADENEKDALPILADHELEEHKAKMLREEQAHKLRWWVAIAAGVVGAVVFLLHILLLVFWPQKILTIIRALDSWWDALFLASPMIFILLLFTGMARAAFGKADKRKKSLRGKASW